MKENTEEARKGSQEHKGELPAAVFSSRYVGRAYKGAESTLSGLVCLDVDKLEEGELQEHRSRLVNDPRVLALFTSPSGTGLKVLVRLQGQPKKIENEQDRRSFWATYERAAFLLGFNKPDTNAKDPERLCFLPYDPEAFVNPNAEPVPWVEYVAPPAPPRSAPLYSFGEVSEFASQGFTLEDVVREIEHDKDQRYPLEEGMRNENTYKHLAAYAENGVPRDVAEEILRAKLWPDKEHVADVARQAEDAYSRVPFGGNPWAVHRLTGKKNSERTANKDPFYKVDNAHTQREATPPPSSLKPWSLEALLEDARNAIPPKLTGWEKFDAKAKLRPGGLCIVGAMPGGGKSLFLVNLLLRMAHTYPEEVFYYFSAEMSARETFLRMGQALSYLSEENRHRRTIPRGEGGYLDNELRFHSIGTNPAFTQANKPKGYGEHIAQDGELLAELYRLRKEGETFSELVQRSPEPASLAHFAEGQTTLHELVSSGRVRIMDSPSQVIYTEDLEQELQEARERGDQIGAVFVDYATRVATREAEGERELRLRTIASSRALTRIAKDFHLPVVLASQLTREAHGTSDKRSKDNPEERPVNNYQALKPYIPSGDKFSESSDYFKDADLALYLANPGAGAVSTDNENLEKYKEHGEFPLFVKVEKCRGGEAGALVELGYVPHAQALHGLVNPPPGVLFSPSEQRAHKEGRGEPFLRADVL